jgi:WD40 repeat protein
MKEGPGSVIILRECKSKKIKKVLQILLNFFFKNLFFRVYSVLYSMDDRFVLSGSDDTNVRFWKANANDAIKLVREKYFFKNIKFNFFSF